MVKVYDTNLIIEATKRKEIQNLMYLDEIDKKEYFEQLNKKLFEIYGDNSSYVGHQLVLLELLSCEYDKKELGLVLLVFNFFAKRGLSNFCLRDIDQNLMIEISNLYQKWDIEEIVKKNAVIKNEIYKIKNINMGWLFVFFVNYLNFAYCTKETQLKIPDIKEINGLNDLKEKIEKELLNLDKKINLGHQIKTAGKNFLEDYLILELLYKIVEEDISETPEYYIQKMKSPIIIILIIQDYINDKTANGKYYNGKKKLQLKENDITDMLIAAGLFLDNNGKTIGYELETKDKKIRSRLSQANDILEKFKKNGIVQEIEIYKEFLETGDRHLKAIEYRNAVRKRFEMNGRTEIIK